MKKLMTAMLALSFLGATAMFAQVPAAAPDKSDTAKKPAKKAAKKTTEKKDTTEAAKKPAKKAAKKTDATEKK
jgi:Ni/Co efflux regulator RcnB